jgi:electron transport complex protein RnfC
MRAPDPSPNVELACIRCGACAQACPVQLLPQMLLWHVRAGNQARLQAQGLTDCLECGACDRVCPSNIPLAAIFVQAKGAQHVRAEQLGAAAAARERHVARQQRLEREAVARANRDAVRRDGAASADAVAAALARARAKRGAAADPERGA